MGKTMNAARAATAEMIKPKAEADDSAPPPPEPTIAEERQSALRIALDTYRVQLMPWKFLAAAIVAGAIVHGDDISWFTTLCLTPFLAIAAYWFTEFRLTRQHIAAGRVEMGERSGRRVRRINRRAARSAYTAIALGVWLGLVSLSHPAHWTGHIVWTLGAVVWGLTSYAGWWRPADTSAAPARPFTTERDEDDTPAAAPPTAAAPGPRVPPRRRPQTPAAGGIPVPRVDGQPLTTPASPGGTAHVPLPDASLLSASNISVRVIPVDDKTAQIQEVFTARGMDVTVVGEPARGPSVTRYTLRVPPSVSVKKVVGMAEDLRLNCGSPDLQVMSPVGGKPLVGVEVPNREREVIPLGLVLNSEEAKRDHHPLLVAFGKDSDGNFLLIRLSDLVHLLVGGATGGGKSGIINAIIVSLLLRATPAEVRLLLIDPKRVELTRYNGIPHLLTPVVTDPMKAANALDLVVEEMDQRYKAMERHGVRHIDDYNRKVMTGEITAPEGAKYALTPYAYWVIIIDELASLMSVAKEDIEKAHARITAEARAAGIHLIDGTQRPSVDVVTGVIKANIPSRLAVACASLTDSRVILDQPGAERLLGKGDALLRPFNSSSTTRLQIAWVDDREIEAVVEHWKKYGDITSPVLPEGLLDAPRESAEMPAPMTTREVILDAARRLANDAGEVTKPQIVRATKGINDKTRDYHLGKLVNDGFLVRVTNGNFRVPAEGEAAAPDTTEEEEEN